MTTTLKSQLVDIVDLLVSTRYLAGAVYMAAADSSVSTNATNAIQAVLIEIESRLESAEERLEGMKDALS
ncbi:hypothetical protein [Pararhizobium sp. O133]|uniref:hypothetical protein n=1 Tax=Pararhizobium sp. O133 TaxID=3449278 RepID=UPI003F686A97